MKNGQFPSVIDTFPWLVGQAMSCLGWAPVRWLTKGNMHPIPND